MIFKQCSLCKQEWSSRESFLYDPEIIIIGYQADFNRLERGLYLFNHEKSGCGTTLACYVQEFLDIYSGHFYQVSRLQTEECPGFCLDKNNIKSCSVKCKNSYPRSLLQVLKDMKLNSQKF